MRFIANKCTKFITASSRVAKMISSSTKNGAVAFSPLLSSGAESRGLAVDGTTGKSMHSTIAGGIGVCGWLFKGGGGVQTGLTSLCGMS